MIFSSEINLLYFFLTGIIVFIGIDVLNLVFRKLFPNAGPLVKTLRRTHKVFNYKNGPFILILFFLGIIIIAAFNLPMWTYYLFIVLYVVLGLRLSDKRIK